MTFEYDLAILDENASFLIHCLERDELAKVDDQTIEALNELVEDPKATPPVLREMLAKDDEEALEVLDSLDDDEKARALFASCYLLSVEGSKGSHALDLAYHLQANQDGETAAKPVEVPAYIRRAILWTCRQDDAPEEG
jgi:hypothetical protein